MCLHNINDEDTQLYKNRKRAITVYKLIRKKKEINGKTAYHPPYSQSGGSRLFLFQKGENVDVNPHRWKIGPHYFEGPTYLSGFHSFLSLEDAKRYRELYFNSKNIIIVKATVKPSTVIAVGEQKGKVIVSSAVTINSFSHCR